ncbi:MAG TPA: RNA methyltransferase [Bacteroidales bacterium]
MVDKITSLQNPRIKNIVHLSKARERREQNLMVVEGFRETFMAFQSGFEIKELYFSKETNLHPDTAKLLRQLPTTCQTIDVSKTVFEKIAYRENSDGLIALVTPKYMKPDELELSANPLILVLESVEKPGNLGAILRTADAAAIDAVMVCDPQTDIFNPNVVRSSLGCIFSKQVVTCTSNEAIQFLRKKGIKTYAAALSATSFYHETDFSGPTAIVMGTEADGLTESWLNGADYQIKIPMAGKVDSLNVSTSAAVLVFEVKRQRGF